MSGTEKSTDLSTKFDLFIVQDGTFRSVTPLSSSFQTARSILLERTKDDEGSTYLVGTGVLRVKVPVKK